jgi:hypothetical protein
MSQLPLTRGKARKHISCSANEFISFGLEIMKRRLTRRTDVFQRRWKEMFGVTPEVCSKLWDLCDPYNAMPNAVKPVYLLWALAFLKQYNTESNSASAVGGPDEKTYRKWVWLFVDEISYQEARVVSVST